MYVLMLSSHGILCHKPLATLTTFKPKAILSNFSCIISLCPLHKIFKVCTYGCFYYV